MQLDEVLIAVNVAVYTSIAAGVIQGRRRRTTMRPSGTDAAFNQLESALVKRFPDLPEGFTMREGLSRVRSLEPDLRWDRIEESLEGYEAYRYGGDPVPSGEQPELAKLIHKLRSPW
jgi:hypothetical protein